MTAKPAGGIGTVDDTAPTLDDWVAWKTRCALALCPAEVQRALQSFVYLRFRRFVARYAHRTNIGDPSALTPVPPDAWHCFESCLQLRNARPGKSYKAWLFARAAPSLDSVQSGATMLLRDAVREHLRREFSRRGFVSLDAPAAGGDEGSALSLSELLPSGPDPRDEVARREMEQRAGMSAAAVFAEMPGRERIVLLARVLGLPLSLPAVTETAGCGKSMLCTTYRAALRRIADRVRSGHPQEDAVTWAQLSVHTYEKLRERICLWGRSQAVCARLFMMVEEGRPAAGLGRRPPARVLAAVASGRGGE